MPEYRSASGSAAEEEVHLYADDRKCCGASKSNQTWTK